VAVVGDVGQGAMVPENPGPPSVVSADRHELYNAAAIIAERRPVATYSKWLLPNYGVFDEGRYFHPGRRLSLVGLRGVTIAVNICEDIWFPDGPTRAQAAAGADIIVNNKSSPFHIGERRFPEQKLGTKARGDGLVVTYTQTPGGQDENVFYGDNVDVDKAGGVVA